MLEKDPNYYDADEGASRRVVYKPITDGRVRLANLRSGDVQIGDQMAPRRRAQRADRAAAPALQLALARLPGHRSQHRERARDSGRSREASTPRSPVSRRSARPSNWPSTASCINKVVFQGMYEPACGPVSPESAIAPGVSAALPPARRRRSQAAAQGGRGEDPRPPRTEGVDHPRGQQARPGHPGHGQGGGIRRSGCGRWSTPRCWRRPTPGGYEAYVSGWSGRLDPDGNIASFLGTAGAMNTYGVSDPALDRLIAQGRTDPRRHGTRRRSTGA